MRWPTRGLPVSDWFTEQASSGSLLAAIPVALIAGLVSFFSPCVVPLLPGYLSYATGLSGADLASGAARRHRGRLFAGSVLFVLGFSVVFVLLGMASGAIGGWLFAYQRPLGIGLGLLNILLGAVFAGLLPILQRDVRSHAVPAVGLVAAPLLGFLFGLGWTPCTGPTLGVITTMSITEATPGRGALLSACYAVGVGVPFLLAGLFYERMLVAIGWVRRHQVWVMRVGGIMMIVLGIAMVTGWWTVWVSWLQVHLAPGFEVTV